MRTGWALRTVGHCKHNGGKEPSEGGHQAWRNGPGCVRVGQVRKGRRLAFSPTWVGRCLNGIRTMAFRLITFQMKAEYTHSHSPNRNRRPEVVVQKDGTQPTV